TPPRPPQIHPLSLHDALPIYALFKDLHSGMILDAAGQRKEAGRRLERAYKADSSALRVVEAYGSYLSREGRKEDALKVYQTFNKDRKSTRLNSSHVKISYAVF